jgi:hypothetical protein
MDLSYRAIDLLYPHSHSFVLFLTPIVYFYLHHTAYEWEPLRYCAQIFSLASYLQLWGCAFSGSLEVFPSSPITCDLYRFVSAWGGGGGWFMAMAVQAGFSAGVRR